AHACLFPDPMALTQDVREKDSWFHAPILKDRVFPHLMSTALVTERVNEKERRYRRKVEKRGKDPHHSFAMMLCDVAMVRAYGTATFLLPDLTPPAPTSPEHHPIVQQLMHHRREGTCGGCAYFRLKDGTPGTVGAGVCGFNKSKDVQGVSDRDPSCRAYVAGESAT
ncbi:hypothetical protein, partial [Phenylobacterium sp.]|uniref:hypothetical protein n=1 Tax=Phenylobacterium sp. TaxID=1871053 RepID=UPI0039831F39